MTPRGSLFFGRVEGHPKGFSGPPSTSATLAVGARARTPLVPREARASLQAPRPHPGARARPGDLLPALPARAVASSDGTGGDRDVPAWLQAVAERLRLERDRGGPKADGLGRLVAVHRLRRGVFGR